MILSMKIWKDRASKSANKIIIFLVLAGAGTVSYVFLWDIFLLFYNFCGDSHNSASSRASMTLMQSPAMMVKGIIIGLVGPFPWTNMLDSNITGREFLLPAILQAIYNLTILTFFVVSLLKRKINLIRVPNSYILVFVFSLMGMGLLGAGHVAYVTVASVLLLAVIPRLIPFHFVMTFLGITFIFFLLGILWP